MTDETKTDPPPGYKIFDDSYGSWICREPGGWQELEGFVSAHGPDGSKTHPDEYGKAIAACWEHYNSHEGYRAAREELDTYKRAEAAQIALLGKTAIECADEYGDERDAALAEVERLRSCGTMDCGKCLACLEYATHNNYEAAERSEADAARLREALDDVVQQLQHHIDLLDKKAKNEDHIDRYYLRSVTRLMAIDAAAKGRAALTPDTIPLDAGHGSRPDDGGKTPVPLERIEGVEPRDDMRGPTDPNSEVPQSGRVKAEGVTAGKDRPRGNGST